MRDVIVLYRQICAPPLAIPVVTQGMKRAAARAAKAMGWDVAGWRRFYRSVRASEFLCGATGWKASLPWLLKPANLEKVAGGGYAAQDNRILRASANREWVQVRRAIRLGKPFVAVTGRLRNALDAVGGDRLREVPPGQVLAAHRLFVEVYCAGEPSRMPSLARRPGAR